MPLCTSRIKERGSRTLALTQGIAVGGLAFLMLYAVWNKFIYPYFFPYSDDISLIVNSTLPFHPSYSSWFLKGFKNYFDVYPDLFVPYTNFVRPFVNAVYSFDYLIFGSHWGRYFLTTYGFVSIIAATVSYVSSSILRLGWRTSFIVAVCSVFAPSLATAAFFYPSDGFDLCAGMLVLLGVAALVMDELVPAWIFFSIAVLTKETALFAPCVAAAVVFVRKENRPITQRSIISCAFLLPVAAWITLYWHDFHGKQGVNVLKSPVSVGGISKVFSKLKAPLHWPIAAVMRTEYWHSTHLLLKAVFVASIVLNIATWLLLLWVCLTFIKRRGLGLASLATYLKTSPIAVIAVFCAGSLLMPLAFVLPNRFGGVFYPLFLLCLAYAARRNRYIAVRSYSMIMIAAIGVIGCSLIYADIAYYLPNLRGDWAMSRDYMGLLSKSTDPRIFVLDDMSGGFAANSSIRKFSGYRGQLIRLDDLTWKFNCAGNIKISLGENRDGGGNIISVVPRSCGEHDFNGLLLYNLNAPSIRFKRNIEDGVLKYHLIPDTDALDPELDTSRLDITMHLNHSDGVLLVPDLKTQSYHKIKLYHLETYTNEQN